MSPQWEKNVPHEQPLHQTSHAPRSSSLHAVCAPVPPACCWTPIHAASPPLLVTLQHQTNQTCLPATIMRAPICWGEISVSSLPYTHTHTPPKKVHPIGWLQYVCQATPTMISALICTQNARTHTQHAHNFHCAHACHIFTQMQANIHECACTLAKLP